MTVAQLQLLRSGLEDLREFISHDQLHRCSGMTDQPTELQLCMTELIEILKSICHVEHVLDYMVMELEN